MGSSTPEHVQSGLWGNAGDAHRGDLPSQLEATLCATSPCTVTGTEQSTAQPSSQAPRGGSSPFLLLQSQPGSTPQKLPHDQQSHPPFVAGGFSGANRPGWQRRPPPYTSLGTATSTFQIIPPIGQGSRFCSSAKKNLDICVKFAFEPLPPWC